MNIHFSTVSRTLISTAVIALSVLAPAAIAAATTTYALQSVSKTTHVANYSKELARCSTATAGT